MKKYAFLGLVAMLALLLNCSNNNGYGWNPGVTGEGAKTSRTFDIDDFDGVQLAMSANVELTQGSTQSVEISGQPNILDLISTDVNDGVWKIKTTQNIGRHDRINIRITVPRLRYAKVSGSGNMRMMNTFNNSQEMEVGISGSGNLELMLETGDLSARISGSGDIKIDGSATNASYSISGSGDIDALDTEAKSVSIRVSGSGDCDVTAVDNLEVRISGSGDVRYRGQPRVNARTSGSGDLQAI